MSNYTAYYKHFVLNFSGVMIALTRTSRGLRRLFQDLRAAHDLTDSDRIRIPACAGMTKRLITDNELKPNLMKCLIYILFGCSLFTSSCKKTDWYDIKTDKSLSIPTTLKDMQALMDNGLVMNTFTPGMGEVASDGHYAPQVRADAFVGFNRNAYTWSKEQANVNVMDWSQGRPSAASSYSRIYSCNVVLDGMVKIKVNDTKEQAQWNDIKGQALFHRAHAFYELAQVFAAPYESGTAAIKLGIPLRLGSDVSIISIRSTLQQTYDQVINDLLSARSLLPENAQYKTRPSKLAVDALLARVYLSMEDYVKAGLYADQTLQRFSTLMNYSTLNYTANANPIPVYNPEMIFHSTMAGHTALIFSQNLLIDRDLYDSYNINDLRKRVFYTENATTKLVTYKGTYAGVGFTPCFSGLATDEVYLIRAECYARARKVTEAMADLNTLLKSRWLGTYTNITATDAEDALKKVLVERKKELILRGLRWSDLRRLNRDPRFAQTFTRTANGKTYTLEPNSYKYTFPIPDDIIQFTGMQQNEGWPK